MTNSDTRAIVVMGVAASGKTTVGRALAERLGWRFLDADDYHSKTSREKMRAGRPLTDRDRRPWLSRIRRFATFALCRRLLLCAPINRPNGSAIVEAVLARPTLSPPEALDGARMKELVDGDDAVALEHLAVFHHELHAAHRIDVG